MRYESLNVGDDVDVYNAQSDEWEKGLIVSCFCDKENQIYYSVINENHTVTVESQNIAPSGTYIKNVDFISPHDSGVLRKTSKTHRGFLLDQSAQNPLKINQEEQKLEIPPFGQQEELCDPSQPQQPNQRPMIPIQKSRQIEIPSHKDDGNCPEIKRFRSQIKEAAKIQNFELCIELEKEIANIKARNSKPKHRRGQSVVKFFKSLRRFHRKTKSADMATLVQDYQNDLTKNDSHQPKEVPWKCPICHWFNKPSSFLCHLCGASISRKGKRHSAPSFPSRDNPFSQLKVAIDTSTLPLHPSNSTDDVFKQQQQHNNNADDDENLNANNVNDDINVKRSPEISTPRAVLRSPNNSTRFDADSARFV